MATAVHLAAHICTQNVVGGWIILGGRTHSVDKFWGATTPPPPFLHPCYRPILNERLAYSRFFVTFHKFRFLQCKL